MRAQSVVAALLLVALQSAKSTPVSTTVSAEELRAAISARLAAVPAELRVASREFYQARHDQPAWFVQGRATPQARATVAKLQSARWKGLEPHEYGNNRFGGEIQRLEAGADAAAVAAFDVALTEALLRFLLDLHGGRVNPSRNELADQMPLAAIAADVAGSCDVSGSIDAWEPRYDGYRRLLRAFADYIRLAEEGEVEPFDRPARTLAAGAPYAEAGRLGEYLRRLGDLPADAAVTPGVYDSTLASAVTRFQRRHGLEDDGRLGKETFAALEVPVSRTVEAMKLTLERWRWAPRDVTPPSIVVNIPEFRLRGVARDGTRIAMNVIVGEAYGHETPLLAATMRTVVFRPYWNVPASIQRSELVPKIARDYGYVARNDYEIVDDGRVLPVNGNTVAGLASGRLQLRQKPGPSNSLGLVKFVLPNPDNVYLHGTPSQHLFRHTRRDFSHGCIRVEDPVELAVFVLRDQAPWTRERIVQAMNATTSSRVDLVTPVPVLIVYATVVVSRDGEVGVYRDLYGQDAELATWWNAETSRRGR